MAESELGLAIERRIYTVRGERVMLDGDLADLYGVTTANLNKAVKRNPDRFPSDFMFPLSKQEAGNLIFQSGISSSAHGGRRNPPYAFTEHGVTMLSSVLHSPRAVAVNVEIIRAFVRLRALLATHAGLAQKLEALEQQYDGQFRLVFDAIRQLMAPAKAAERKRIGF